MNIQKRLRTSYLLMLLIPILLLALFAGIIRSNDLDETFDNALSREFLARLYEILSQDPSELLNKQVLTELDALSGYRGRTNIDVLKEGETVQFLQNTRHMRSYRNHGPGNMISGRWDFYFTDGTGGTISVIIHNGMDAKGMFISGGVIFLFAVFVLVMTNGLLSWFVARSILVPLKMLEKSATNITHEDLDTPVIYRGKDEFADVCRAFDEMRRRLKDSLQKQVKAENNRKELLSNISHDLKTPITAIKGYVEGIRDGIADTPEKREKYINTVYTKTVLMDELIDRLFLFSKLDLNTIQFNFQKLDLPLFLRDTCEEMRFDYKEMDINLADPQESVFVQADPVHLHRVLMNLADNAWKYRSPEKPELSVSITGENDRVEVLVQDNGRGISREALPYVFERFFRADPARSSSTEGSGLGLAISQQIIRAHGGDIWVESDPGSGTAIRFTLRILS